MGLTSSKQDNKSLGTQMRSKFKKYYLDETNDGIGSTGTTPRRRSEAESLILSFDNDEEDIYELDTMYSKGAQSSFSLENA